MKTLIIYSHPDTDGYCAETLRQVEKKLKQLNKEYEIIDLYKIDYNPVLQEDEHYTAGNKSISQQNLEIQEKIKLAQNLIFIYPIWWGSMPAILKGFFDRILTSGFAFKFKDKGGVSGLLKNKKAVIFVSSGGPQINYLWFDANKRIIKNKILGFCGIDTKIFQVYKAYQLDDKKKKEIAQNIERGLSFLKL